MRRMDVASSGFTIVAPEGTRRAGKAVGLAAVALTAWALVASGLAGLVIVPLLTGWMGAAAVAAHRMHVRGDDRGLVIDGGLRSRTYPWNRVSGFEVVDGFAASGVYVQIEGQGPVRLPFENLGGWGGKLRRQRLRNELEERSRPFMGRG